MVNVYHHSKELSGVVAEAAIKTVFDSNEPSSGLEDNLKFFQQLSSYLLEYTDAQAYPEIVAFGFWLRSRHLQTLLDGLPGKLYKPLGVVVHFAPNNVDTQFVYSWVCSLLMGNRNIVRLGSKRSPLQQQLLESIGHVLSRSDNLRLASQNVFCRYERQDDIGKQLSLLANARVIWGSDESVRAIRSLPCAPTCRDVAFADRYSLMVIDGDNVTAEKIPTLAEAIARDIEGFNQQACSSPKGILWAGSCAQRDAVLAAVGKQLQATEATRTEQLVYSQWLKATGISSGSEQFGILSIATVSLSSSPDWSAHPGHYILHFSQIESLSDSQAWITAKCQTLCYFGFEKESLIKFLSEMSINGVDRLVPVGQALNFSTIWDGYDLLSQLSRRVSFC